MFLIVYFLKTKIRWLCSEWLYFREMTFSCTQIQNEESPQVILIWWSSNPCVVRELRKVTLNSWGRAGRKGPHGWLEIPPVWTQIFSGKSKAWKRPEGSTGRENSARVCRRNGDVVPSHIPFDKELFQDGLAFRLSFRSPSDSSIRLYHNFLRTRLTLLFLPQQVLYCLTPNLHQKKVKWMKEWPITQWLQFEGQTRAEVSSAYLWVEERATNGPKEAVLGSLTTEHVHPSPAKPQDSCSFYFGGGET